MKLWQEIQTLKRSPQVQVLVNLFRDEPEVLAECCPYCFYANFSNWKKSGDEDFGPYICPECNQKFAYLDRRNLLEEFLMRVESDSLYRRRMKHIADRHQVDDDYDRGLQEEAAAIALRAMADVIARLRAMMRDAGVPVCERCDEALASQTLEVGEGTQELCSACYSRVTSDLAF